jgi:hypothetical protein
MLRPERGFGSRGRFSLAVAQQSIWCARAANRPRRPARRAAARPRQPARVALEAGCAGAGHLAASKSTLACRNNVSILRLRWHPTLDGVRMRDGRKTRDGRHMITSWSDDSPSRGHSAGPSRMPGVTSRNWRQPQPEHQPVAEHVHRVGLPRGSAQPLKCWVAAPRQMAPPDPPCGTPSRDQPSVLSYPIWKFEACSCDGAIPTKSSELVCPAPRMLGWPAP